MNYHDYNANQLLGSRPHDATDVIEWRPTPTYGAYANIAPLDVSNSRAQSHYRAWLRSLERAIERDGEQS
jgi:hypothetical protein